jgi:Smg protein
MSDTVLDVLLYLFETYSDQEPPDYKPGAADQDVLRDELLRAGFGEPEVDSALDWLDGLNETSAPFAGVPGDRSIRVYNEVELRRLDLECRGYLLYLEQVGILSSAQREVVIDRLMALGSGTVDKEQVKWVVLMVLFAQPGQEAAFSRMEDLVFEESTGAMN